jgi:Putative zinc-finger
MNILNNGGVCAKVARLFDFYACDELTAAEREQVEAHLAVCKACADQLSQERRLMESLIAVPQSADQIDSAGILLSQCRSELAETLDDLAHPRLREGWRPFGWIGRWMAFRPVWSAAALVGFGILAGAQVAPWHAALNGNDRGQAVNVMAAPRLSDEQLSKMAVAGINFVPGSDAAPGTVQVRLRAEQPLELNGSVDDSDMKRFLTYVVANGNQFDAGVRLDCLEALKARTSDQEVRRSLITAARKDQNAAVRMKALEALRDAAADSSVREVILDALQHDENPGVRVEAVNLLVRALEQNTMENSEAHRLPDQPEITPVPADPSLDRVVRALEELQHGDPNRYVRLRSAAALRQIGQREVQ